MIFYLDVSDDQQIMMKTESQFKRYHALMKNALDGINIMDMQGNIVEVAEYKGKDIQWTY